MHSASAAVPAAVPATRREIFAWAMYDFANSGYTTVVLTAVFNAYFVGVVAGGPETREAGTLLWTIAIAITNTLVLVTAPVLGAIADHAGNKKRFLAVTTAGCVLFTALLGFVGEGDVVFGMALVILATFMFSSGENFISAFLPEIATERNIGRISGYGWSLGYVGGLLVLLVCLLYVQFAEARGAPATHYVPVTMWITAAVFAVAAMPTFLWLRERARRQPLIGGQSYLRAGFARVRRTLSHARHYRDLFRFLITLAIYYCGVNAVVVLTAIYAREVMGFTFQDTIVLILVANLAAAVGAFSFGLLQDRIGSVRTLALILAIWAAALIAAYFVETRAGFWAVANAVGFALGSVQSAGRALVGLFSPPGQAAEFFGLWGLAGKLAAVVGPLTYGIISYASGGNHRLALLSTASFFVVGLVLLVTTVDERRGRAAAVTAP